MEGEQWKPIPGSLGYEASNQGRVRSVMREILVGGKSQMRRGMNLSPSKGGGNRVYVRTSGRAVMVAKIIAVTWLGSTWDDAPTHIDGDFWNTHPDNLALPEEVA